MVTHRQNRASIQCVRPFDVREWEINCKMAKNAHRHRKATAKLTNDRQKRDVFLHWIIIRILYFNSQCVSFLSIASFLIITSSPSRSTPLNSFRFDCNWRSRVSRVFFVFYRNSFVLIAIAILWHIEQLETSERNSQNNCRSVKSEDESPIIFNKY